MRAVFLLFFILTSCSQLTYRSTSQKAGPELGTIGVFKEYIGETIDQKKTLIDLNIPLKLAIETTTISKRELFANKEESKKVQKDSVITSFEILDKVSLLQQINSNKSLLGYLKNTTSNSIVTKVSMVLPEQTRSIVEDANELYLEQNDSSEFVIVVKIEGKEITRIRNSEGPSVDFETSYFCWGTPKGYKVEILDLVPNPMGCGSNQYRSAQKAKRKTDIGF